MTPLALWLIVFTIERSIASKQRSVNLALETVFEFDKADDIKVVDKVQGFLARIQQLLTRDQNKELSRRTNPYQFSDFVEDAIIEIQYLGDDNLQDIFNIINRNIQKRKSDDILDNRARKYLSDKLIEMRNRPIVEIRNNLDDLLRELKSDKKTKSNYILGFINTLYDRNSDNKLSKLVKRLNLFRRSGRKSKIDLKHIIDKVINDVVYEHYNNLESHQRRYIKNYVRSFFANAIPSKQNSGKKESKSSSGTSNEEQAIEIKSDVSNTKKTKKISTHITLYPKTMKDKTFERHKFRTGKPLRKIPPEDVKGYATDDEKIEKVNTADTIEIRTNHSVEINVNLMLKKQRDSREDKYRHKSKSIRNKPKLSHRASTKKAKIHKKNRKTTFAEYTETFGSLYKKTNEDYSSQTKVSTVQPTTSTVKEKILRTMMDFDSKETNTDYNSDELRRKISNGHRKDKTTPKTSNKQARRLNRPTTEHHTTKATTINIPSKTIKNVITSTSSQDTTVTTEITTPPITTIATDSDIFNELEANVTEVKMSEGVNNISTTTDTIFMDLNNTLSKASEKFDVDEYIKRSEFQNIDNEAKKRNIEEIMREDLKFLLSSPTMSTTVRTTDILNELEEAFKI